MKRTHWILPFVFAAPALAAAQIATPAWTSGDDSIIREYVSPNGTVHMDQTLRPGSVIPAGLPLKLFPANAPARLKGYAYFVSVDGKVVVVEADTRRVVRILGPS